MTVAAALPSPPTYVTSKRIVALKVRGRYDAALARQSDPGVIATVTDSGRVALRHATVTYAREVRKTFLAQMSKAQISGMEESCRRIGEALKDSEVTGSLVNLSTRRARHRGPLRGSNT